MQPKSPPNPGRRKFLIGATSAVGAVGIAGAAVPFISAFNPSAAASMGVRGIPALFIFKDGEVASNRAGAAPKAALQSWIEESI